MPSKQRKQQSTKQRRNAAQSKSLLSLAFSVMDRSVWMIATRRLPKQIEPKEVVVARMVLAMIALEQQ
jgi:hypothetical protein